MPVISTEDVQTKHQGYLVVFVNFSKSRSIEVSLPNAASDQYHRQGVYEKKNEVFNHAPVWKRTVATTAEGANSDQYLFYVDKYKFWIISSELTSQPMAGMYWSPID